MGALVGVAGDDLAFVDNTTTGVNAILRSLPLQAGDEIVVSDFGYGGVIRALTFAARERGAAVRTAAMPYPVRSADEVVGAYEAAITPNTRLAIVDHITSESALVLPLAAIAERCRARGVAVLADGAHAPGAIALDIPSLGVDWYVGNLHKWLWVPRSSGDPVDVAGAPEGAARGRDFLGPRPRLPRRVRLARHARPVAAPLRAGGDRVHAHARHRGGPALQPRAGMGRCTASRGAMEHRVRDAGDVHRHDGDGDAAETLGSTPDDAARLRDALLFDHRIEVQVHAFRGRLYARICGQVYIEPSDIERLAAVVLALAGR